jgi:hypothetical protein
MKLSKEEIEKKMGKPDEFGRWNKLIIELTISDSDVGYVWNLYRPQDDSNLTDDEKKIPSSLCSQVSWDSWKDAFRDAFITTLEVVERIEKVITAAKKKEVPKDFPN